MDPSLTEKSWQRINDFHYEYKGSNPAKGIRDLLTVEPLILECAQALWLAEILAVLDDIGDLQFNRMFTDKKLTITNSPSLPLSVDETIFHQTHGTYQTTALPEDIKVGDHVYLYGSPFGFALHPCTEFNGYNLIVEGFNEAGEALLSGFDSTGHSTITESKLLKIFETEFKKPLTYNDLKHIFVKSIYLPKEYPPNSPLSWKEIFDSLNTSINHKFWKEINDSMSLSDPQELLKRSQIQVPKQYQKEPMLGCLLTRRNRQRHKIGV